MKSEQYEFIRGEIYQISPDPYEIIESSDGSYPVGDYSYAVILYTDLCCSEDSPLNVMLLHQNGTDDDIHLNNSGTALPDCFIRLCEVIEVRKSVLGDHISDLSDYTMDYIEQKTAEALGAEMLPVDADSWDD